MKSSSIEKPLIASAKGLTPERQPVWFLRQAGRYLPEYQAIRSKVEFTELCRRPDLVAEVTLQPLARYDVDAAIIFSDILIPCTVMGQDLSFGKGHGPQLTNPVRDLASLQKLRRPDCEKELGYVGEGIAKTKLKLGARQTMIGFAGAPFTVASYMIEGAGSKNYTEVKMLRYQHQLAFEGLLDLLSEVTVDYLLMQVRAGAECLMLFDSWAGAMTAPDYKDFVLPAVNKVFKGVKAETQVPIIYYPGQGFDRYYELGGFLGDVIAVDWRGRLSRAIEILKEAKLNVSVQGNLDPQTLIADEHTIRQATRNILQEGKQARGHIFNLGHGLLPHTPPEALSWVVEELRLNEKA